MTQKFAKIKWLATRPFPGKIPDTEEVVTQVKARKVCKCSPPYAEIVEWDYTPPEPPPAVEFTDAALKALEDAEKEPEDYDGDVPEEGNVGVAAVREWLTTD
jgi:hypothetical protein